MFAYIIEHIYTYNIHYIYIIYITLHPTNTVNGKRASIPGNAVCYTVIILSIPDTARYKRWKGY